MKRTLFLTSTFLCMAATPALAHPGHFTSDFSVGLLHPFLGLDHMLAMGAVGLLAVQKGGKSLIGLPALFIAMMLIGGAMGMSLLNIPFIEQGILGSVIILGIVIAAGRRIPSSFAMTLVGFFALFHGVAHGVEIPAGVGNVVYAAGFASATFVLHGLGLVIGKTMPTLVSDALLSKAFRLAGAAVAIAGFGLATA